MRLRVLLFCRCEHYLWGIAHPCPSFGVPSVVGGLLFLFNVRKRREVVEEGNCWQFAVWSRRLASSVLLAVDSRHVASPTCASG